MDLSWASDFWGKYGNLYRLYGDYYNGKHANYFDKLDDKNKNHPRLVQILAGLKDNMCRPVVDSLTARLELMGISAPDEKVQDFLDSYFSEHRVTSVAKAVHRDVVLYGDAYVLVAPGEDGTPVISHERPYNIACKYSYTGEIEQAVKWVVEVVSATQTVSHYWFYTKDRIYRRKCSGAVVPGSGSFETLELDGEEPDINNPWGKVPLFHFFNGMRPDAFCRSELGDVVPLQIALNKELQSRELASDLSAFRQKWMTGVSIPVDEQGNPVSNLMSALDKVWSVSNPDVKFGEFGTTDLANYTQTASDLREEICRVSRVPFHVMGLGGDFPSGEALKTAEAPLIAKISDKQLLLGDVWEDVFGFVLGLANFAAQPLEALWANTQPHSEREQWEIALMKKDMGVSTDQILAELGYTQEQIDEFNASAEAAASRAFAAFNAGGGGGDS